MVRARIEEVKKTGATVEFGEEDRGICLSVRWFHPLKARPNYAIVATPFAEHSASIAASSHCCDNLPKNKVPREINEMRVMVEKMKLEKGVLSREEYVNWRVWGWKSCGFCFWFIAHRKHVLLWKKTWLKVLKLSLFLFYLLVFHFFLVFIWKVLRIV